MAKGVSLWKVCGWGAGRHGCNVALGPPRPLQAVNPGRSLFLLYALKSSPRLGLLYLYLFDYTDTFLPFIHTICPLPEDGSGEDLITKLLVGLRSASGGAGPPVCSVIPETWLQPVRDERKMPSLHLNLARRDLQKKAKQQLPHSQKPALCPALQSKRGATLCI